MVSPGTVTLNEQPSYESKFKGVRKRKRGKWVSEIRVPNSRERIWLGSYDSPEKAARAFDAAQFCLSGRHANFNFPENPPEIVGAESLSPHQIQIAAAKFANECEPQQISRDGSDLRGQGDLPAVAHNNAGNCLASSSAMSENGETRIDWSFLDALNTNDEESYPAFPQSPLMPVHSLQENEDADMDEFDSHQPLLWNFDT